VRFHRGTSARAISAGWTSVQECRLRAERRARAFVVLWKTLVDLSIREASRLPLKEKHK
jgi:hypothetical protein